MSGHPPLAYLWTNMAYNIMLVTLGIPGNLLIMKVYYIKSPRCSAHIFIIGLALADLFAVSIRPLYIFLQIPSYARLIHTNEYLCRIPRSLVLTTMYSSVFLTTVVAFDRYFCVCRPHERKMTPLRAKLLVSLSMILGVCVSLPNTFAVGLLEIPSVGTVCTFVGGRWLRILQIVIMATSNIVAGVSVVVLYRKVLRALKEQSLRMRNFDKPIPSFLPPEVAAEMEGSTVVTTVSSISQVQPISLDIPANHRREAFVDNVTIPSPSSVGEVEIGNRNKAADEIQRSKREKTAAAFNVQGRTSKMLLLTTSVLFITWTPPMLIALIPANRRPLALNYVLQAILNLVLLNHVINPVIYGFVNKRFRNDCVKVIRAIKWPWKRRF